MLLAILAVTVTSGKLFLVGGGKTPEEIVTRFIQECGGPEASIVVMPLASAEPEKSKGSFDFLVEHGAKNLYFFGKSNPTEADLAELDQKLKGAKGLWMPGGDQTRYMTRLGKPWIKDHIVPLVSNGLNIYGTSAGSMVCADQMIAGPGKEPDTAEIADGFGLTKWVIDTHFSQRKREGRLRDALKTIAGKLGRPAKGVGINESEWIVIQDDEIKEKHGNPLVIE